MNVSGNYMIKISINAFLPYRTIWMPSSHITGSAMLHPARLGRDSHLLLQLSLFSGFLPVLPPPRVAQDVTKSQYWSPGLTSNSHRTSLWRNPCTLSESWRAWVNFEKSVFLKSHHASKERQWPLCTKYLLYRRLQASWGAKILWKKVIKYKPPSMKYFTELTCFYTYSLSVNKNGSAEVTNPEKHSNSRNPHRIPEFYMTTYTSSPSEANKTRYEDASKESWCFYYGTKQLHFGFSLLSLMTNNQVWDQEPLSLHLVRGRAGRLVQLLLMILCGCCENPPSNPGEC